MNSDFRFRESRREYIRKPKQRGRRYKAVFAAKGAYLQAFWRKAHLIGATLGRCATISHGKVFRRMKFSKRMLVMLVATVMLVAGALSYFAVAAEVLAVTSTCPRCGTGTIYHNIPVGAGDPSGQKTHINNGYNCTYSFFTKYFEDICNNCGYVTGTSSVVCERNHICGIPDD